MEESGNELLPRDETKAGEQKGFADLIRDPPNELKEENEVEVVRFLKSKVLSQFHQRPRKKEKKKKNMLTREVKQASNHNDYLLI